MIALLIEWNFYGKFPAVNKKKCAIEIFIQEIKFLIEYLALNLNKARELFRYRKKGYFFMRSDMYRVWLETKILKHELT